MDMPLNLMECVLLLQSPTSTPDMIDKALEQMAVSQLYTQLTWSPSLMDSIVRCLEDWYKTPWAGLVAFRLAMLRVGSDAEIEVLLRRIQNQGIF